MPGSTINIRPPVSVYATYRRLSYQPWYAIAEFVDNSTQNYYAYKQKLLEAYDREWDGKLQIKIQYDKDNNSLIIYDNANGMDISELTRAVVLDSPPTDRSGRSEFGMGLKTAACWFGRRWQIETTRLGAKEKYTVLVDVDELCQTNKEFINVKIEKELEKKHYTKIIIYDMYKPLKGRTVGKIKDLLSSMYRVDLRSGEIEIWYDGLSLKFEEVPILVEVSGQGKIIWKKELDFEVPWEDKSTTLKVNGWVGVRSPGSQKDAGFVLMRRGRVIIGGPDYGYKPQEIFGQGNSFRSQRLIGELHLDEWPVTQAKDNFDWSGGLEDNFVDSLKIECEEYMEKAENYRQTKFYPSSKEMNEAIKSTKTVFSRESFAKSISNEIAYSHAKDNINDNIENTSHNYSSNTVASVQENKDHENINLKKQDLTIEDYKKTNIEKIKAISDGPQKFTLRVGNIDWEFNLHWQSQISDAHWMELQFIEENRIEIFLNSAHPFFLKYIDNPELLELLTKFVLSMALAEKMARTTRPGELVDPADFRHNMNKVLKYAAEIKNE